MEAETILIGLIILLIAIVVLIICWAKKYDKKNGYYGGLGRSSKIDDVEKNLITDEVINEKSNKIKNQINENLDKLIELNNSINKLSENDHVLFKTNIDRNFERKNSKFIYPVRKNDIEQFLIDNKAYFNKHINQDAHGYCENLKLGAVYAFCTIWNENYMNVFKYAVRQVYKNLLYSYIDDKQFIDLNSKLNVVKNNFENIGSLFIRFDEDLLTEKELYDKYKLEPISDINDRLKKILAKVDKNIELINKLRPRIDGETKLDEFIAKYDDIRLEFVNYENLNNDDKHKLYVDYRFIGKIDDIYVYKLLDILGKDKINSKYLESVNKFNNLGDGKSTLSIILSSYVSNYEKNNLNNIIGDEDVLEIKINRYLEYIYLCICMNLKLDNFKNDSEYGYINNELVKNRIELKKVAPQNIYKLYNKYIEIIRNIGVYCMLNDCVNVSNCLVNSKKLELLITKYTLVLYPLGLQICEHVYLNICDSYDEIIVSGIKPKLLEKFDVFKLNQIENTLYNDDLNILEQNYRYIFNLLTSDSYDMFVDIINYINNESIPKESMSYINNEFVGLLKYLNRLGVYDLLQYDKQHGKYLNNIIKFKSIKISDLLSILTKSESGDIEKKILKIKNAFKGHFIKIIDDFIEKIDNKKEELSKIKKITPQECDKLQGILLSLKSNLLRLREEITIEKIKDLGELLCLWDKFETEFNLLYRRKKSIPEPSQKLTPILIPEPSSEPDSTQKISSPLQLPSIIFMIDTLVKAVKISSDEDEEDDYDPLIEKIKLAYSKNKKVFLNRLLAKLIPQYGGSNKIPDDFPNMLNEANHIFDKTIKNKSFNIHHRYIAYAQEHGHVLNTDELNEIIFEN